MTPNALTSNAYLSDNRSNAVNSVTFIPWLGLLVLSLLSAFLCMFSFEKSGYQALFLLPISFIMILVLNLYGFMKNIKNLGYLLVIGIEFVRLVIAPALFVLGDYPLTIALNAEQNAIFGILLMVYESFWIAFALKKSSSVRITKKYCYDNSVRRLTFILIILVAVTAFICFMAPEILKNYRTILQIRDPDFTSVEQGYIVDKYSSSLVKKFFLVTANYWLKPMRLVIPALMMVIAKKTGRKSAKLFCMFLAVTPLLLIDGTIARSLYFTLILGLLFIRLYDINMKYLLIMLGFVAVFIVAYWYIRFSVSSSDASFIAFLAEKANDYFSGFNIVSGIGNLPLDMGTSLKYLCDDFIHAVPYANTLFGLDAGDTSRTFFNGCNATQGCIASTLAMSGYYLTPVLAPLFSSVFVFAAVRSGNKAKDPEAHLNTVLYNLMAIYFALGIGVNEIGVTIGNIVQVIFIVFLVVFCTRRHKIARR